MTKLMTMTTTAADDATGLDGNDLVVRVGQVPGIFADFSGAALLQQLPAIKQTAAAHKAASDQALLLGQLKGLTRAYRREILLADDAERLEPTDVIGYLNELEGILAAADTAGLGREGLVAKADGLTQKIVATMAVIGLLV